MYQDNYSVEDLLMQAGVTNLTSAFSAANTIFIDFKEPNLVRLTTITGVTLSKYNFQYPLDVFIEHPLNLSTIPVSQFKAFTDLAVCDVAKYLYGFLKWYDQTPTIFANADLKLDELRDTAGRRDDVYEKLKEDHVSAANANQPMIFTI
jgi:hypothetical protein